MCGFAGSLVAGGTALTERHLTKAELAVYRHVAISLGFNLGFPLLAIL
jgi:hypothetical protein